MQRSETGKDIKKAADILKNGGIVIYPTETVYGIGANIFSEKAVKKVFAAKKRAASKPVSVAVCSFNMMDGLVYISDEEKRFIRKFMPGPVTILLRKKETVPDMLTSGQDMVGIRYPDHRIALKLIELAGIPITSTSANISGETPPGSVDDLRIMGDYVLDFGECRGEPSTVVDIVNRKILRKGARSNEVAAALEELMLSEV
ncbi:MAG TPA: L-threonylcarbamoyladenylate synthase [Candidatus Methanoperedens sp.]